MRLVVKRGVKSVCLPMRCFQFSELDLSLPRRSETLPPSRLAMSGDGGSGLSESVCARESDSWKRKRGRKVN